MTAHDELFRLVHAELKRPVGRGVETLTERIRERHGTAVRAILFYGSCLRDDVGFEGIFDLYVLVDSYGPFYANRLLAALNALLPPNVFYVETTRHGETVRAKYAVVSLEQFRAYNSRRCFQAYFWARFAQPTVLAYAADEDVEEAVAGAVADAVETFVRRGLPLVPERFPPRDLWRAELAASYRAEVRAERSGVPERLYAAAPARYVAATRAALPRLPYPFRIGGEGEETVIQVELPAAERRLGPWLWGLRAVLGKALSLARILKGALTFEGGVDYAIWKVERHSGEKVDPSWRHKRFPWLALAGEVWRFYRKGALR